MKTIKLTQGYQTIVDDTDYEELIKYKWYYKDSYGGGYAARNTTYVKGRPRETIRMHRQILGLARGTRVDHISGNKLDNRRSNLRYANAVQNGQNRKKQKGSSIYKGVTFHKKEGKWRAQIQVNKNKIMLGRFEDEKSAGVAYIEAAKKYFGEFARI